MNSFLTCPKCHGQMRQYERNSVTVDQCGECRGIFLDRGELERLVEAEARWSGGRPQPTQRYEQPLYEQPRYEDRRYEQRHYDDDYHHGQKHYKSKKRKSFFEELFDD